LPFRQVGNACRDKEVEMKRLVLGVGLGVALASLIARSAFLSRLLGKPSLDELTKEELYRRAQEAEVPGRSGMSKGELVDALKEE
jgi:hypothetical protein